MTTLFPPLPPVRRLLADDPFWRYPSSCLAGEGIAHLRVWSTTAAGETAAWHWSPAPDSARPLPNSAAEIWAALTGRFGEPLVVLKHWPAGDGADHDRLDQVLVDTSGVSWRRIWPTGPDNPRHAELNAWITTNRRALQLPEDQ